VTQEPPRHCLEPDEGERTGFGNLDVDLRSSADLSALAAHFEQYYSLLFHGREDGESLLRLEPDDGAKRRCHGLTVAKTKKARCARLGFTGPLRPGDGDDAARHCADSLL